MQNLAILFFLFIFSNCFGQNNEFIHGGNDDDQGNCFTTNISGGFRLVGSERVAPDSSTHLSIIGIDKNGNYIQKHTWGGIRNDVATHIEKTEDGGAIISGYRMEGGFARRDGFLMKVNQNEQTEWFKYYGGINKDELYSVKQCQDLGFIACGFSNSDTSGSYGKIYLVKTDKNGDLEWSSYIGGQGKDIGFDVIENSNNEFLTVGTYSGFHDYSTFEYVHSNSDILVSKTTNLGQIIWQKNIGGIENELGYQIKESPGGGYLIIGSTQSEGNGSFDIYLVKIDEDGNIQWTKTFGDQGFEYGKSLDVDDQFIYIAGTANVDTLTFETDFIIIKTDLQGNEIWTSIFGGEKSDYANYIRTTENGGCAVIGTSKSFSDGDENICFFKLDSIGLIESFPFNNTESINIFPNPSNNKINLKVDNSIDCFNYTYQIIDYRGKIIYEQYFYTKLTNISIDRLSAGMYTLKVSSPCDEILTGKFIVN